MRTIEEIKKEMTDAVLANETLCTAFGLDANEEWDGQVSAVSILNLIIYIVAMAARTVEWLHDQFRAEVEARIAAAFPGTVSWYWNKIMQFQYGYELNENAVYGETDTDAQIVKHCAVFEVDNGIVVKVNKGTRTYDQLTQTELAALKEYVRQIKFAGTVAYVYSFNPDELDLEINIWRDPMVLDEDMNRIVDGEPVITNAIIDYLNGIAYGGVLNKTKLIDAIQAVEGVIDVTIDDAASYVIDYATDQFTGTEHSFADFVNNSFRSVGGHFLIDEVIYNDKINQQP